MNTAPSSAKPSATALLVVDVQQGLFQKSTPVYRAADLIHNIQILVDAAHRAHVPVVYIQHNDKNSLAKDTPAWQLHPEMSPAENDLRVDKQHSNAFEETPLDDLLKARGVNHVVVTGLVTHGCVKNTCLGALERGYQVMLVSDAHSSFSDKAAELVVKWHDHLSKEGVAVKPAQEITF